LVSSYWFNICYLSFYSYYFKSFDLYK